VQEAIYLKDYKAPDFSIEKVELVFDIFEEYTLVTNTMQLTKKRDVSNLVLDSIDLELIEIKLQEKKLNEKEYQYKEQKLTIFDVEQSFSITIKNKLYPHKNTELEGLYKSGDIFCTQNEPEGFRCITPFIDRPDIMSVYTTTVIAEKQKYPVLLSNGNKMQCHEFYNNGRHGVTWHDPFAKPSYLFALVAGDLDVLEDSFTTMSGKEVALNIYVDKGNKEKTHHAMESLKKAMLWDEQKYGREYDLSVYNIVAVDSFNMGAMENKGLNIFNSTYVLSDKKSATDDNFMGIESVIAHEYFHNWTGNRITCRDWFSLTLKEGLTVFRDQCFSADMNSKDVQRILDVKALKERQFVEDASPTAHPIQPKSYISMNNFYTATVYEKGAEVIRMLHTLFGEKKFREAMDLYFETFDGKAITTDDFLWAMQEVYEEDLTQFKLWYDQVRTPKLAVEESFEDGVYKLTLTQKVPNDLEGNAQKPYMYPLKIALLDKTTQKVAKEQMLLITKERETFVFEGFTQKPILSINRDFSAPIIVEYSADYRFLMKHDTNSFIRYESLQDYTLEQIYKVMNAQSLDKEYIEAFEYLLKPNDNTLALQALLLEFPTPSMVMQNLDEVDFEEICNALYIVRYTLAKEYKEQLITLYEKYHNPQDDSLAPLSMAKRSFKNSILKLLGSLNTQEIATMAYMQYRDSQTMTDKIVAFDVAQSLPNKEYAKEIEGDFYAHYHKDKLTITKYFATIALEKDINPMSRVIKMQNDPAYDEKIPNHIRALIGSFSRNYRYFHAKDGSGYEFIATKIIEIDKNNPQMASALLSSFKVYKKLKKESRELMQKALERVNSTHSLSKNTFEIVDKILNN